MELVKTKKVHNYTKEEIEIVEQKTPALAAERECSGRESFNLGVEDWSGFPGFPRDTWVATDILDGAGPLLDTASAKEPLWKAERRRFASCQDTRLREAGVEAVYCLARGAPKGPNIPRAQLNHQGPLFPGHGYATHSQTWVGEPTWLGVRSDATHQAPTKVGAPCVRVWWPTWLGSVVTLLTKHLAPKVQAPPAGLGRLMGQQTRTLLPVLTSHLEPETMPTKDVHNRLQKIRQRRRRYYNHGARDLPTFSRGQQVMTHEHGLLLPS
ncbi:hypothetical protein ISCGN_032104 [Ixodes scapularis]